MLVVVTDNKLFPGEADELNQLFDEGMPVLHMRKYESSKQGIIELLDKIKPEYYSRIALHQYHEMSQEYGLKRIHFSETDRIQQTNKQLQRLKEDGFVLSTSVHSADSYYGLDEAFEYTFLGPVFDSISKFGYKARKFDLSKKHPKVKVIALGGISADNCKQASVMGFDGVGVLGSIWNAQDRIESFSKVKESFSQNSAKDNAKFR